MQRGRRTIDISVAELSALFQVIFVDLVLAGDNAIVVGMVAAGLPAADRRRVIIIGIAAATVMRILFAAVTVQLMQVVGLVLAGGLLLLWVSWKLWREIEERRKEAAAAKAVAEATLMATPDEESEASTESATEAPPRTTLRQAVVQIVIADLSMSLDNVLAVAGIARAHTWILVTGLVFSVAFMGLAAAYIARLLERHHWIAYVGLAVIFYVAIEMIVGGAQDVALISQ
ncbi:MAG: YjbE family putative metal transport protein [Gammaproteobacteria bacterium]|nr:YjbE family putative metal transport protein [Gammaproteobacteria bacterium]